VTERQTKSSASVSAADSELSIDDFCDNVLSVFGVASAATRSASSMILNEGVGSERPTCRHTRLAIVNI